MNIVITIETKGQKSHISLKYFQWQQTEDFSRKKEIRAHMYRLREERLRNLYSPEPTADGTKGKTGL